MPGSSARQYIRRAAADARPAGAAGGKVLVSARDRSLKAVSEENTTYQAIEIERYRLTAA